MPKLMLRIMIHCQTPGPLPFNIPGHSSRYHAFLHTPFPSPSNLHLVDCTVRMNDVHDPVILIKALALVVRQTFATYLHEHIVLSIESVFYPVS